MGGEVRKRVLPLLKVRHVQLADDYLRALSLELRQGILIDVVDADGPACSQELLGHRAANALRAAGDENGRGIRSGHGVSILPFLAVFISG